MPIYSVEIIKIWLKRINDTVLSYLRAPLQASITPLNFEVQSAVSLFRTTPAVWPPSVQIPNYTPYTLRKHASKGLLKDGPNFFYSIQIRIISRSWQYSNLIVLKLPHRQFLTMHGIFFLLERRKGRWAIRRRRDEIKGCITVDCWGWGCQWFLRCRRRINVVNYVYETWWQRNRLQAQVTAFGR